MLGSIKAFFSGAIAKVVFGLLIAAALLAWYFKNEHDKTQLELQNKTAEANRLNGELETMKKEFNTLKESNRINEDVGDGNRQEKKESDTKTGEIKNNVVKKIQEIEKKYDNVQPTPESVKAKADEKSIARLNGVWGVFCTGTPTNPKCVNVVDVPASGASKQ